jgi:ATP phosphoribosyltransferase regulatory subunit HisZ
MNEQSHNDNQAARTQNISSPQPDAHGQAALLLTESLLHGLIARSVITVADAIEIVSVATDVKDEIAADLGDSSVTKYESLCLFSAIRRSLENDLPGE